MLQKFFLNRVMVTRLTIRDLLFISCCFSCFMLVGRAAITGLVTYAFLLWNLFLAFVPYAITQWLADRPQFYKKKLSLVFVILIWLLFIPNSFYILTDLFHLNSVDTTSKWFDLLLIFSFAWNGLLLGMLSVRTIERIAGGIWGQGFSLILLFVVMWLNAFGVYIGRYLRFNSWDVITQPLSLFREMSWVLLHPLQHKMEWGMISSYAVFMLVLYTTLKKLSENFHATTH